MKINGVGRSVEFGFVDVFALVVCIALGAPWWAYALGALCLWLDSADAADATTATTPTDGAKAAGPGSRPPGAV